MVECAVREAFEETGLHLLNDADAGGSDSIGTLQLRSIEISKDVAVWSGVLCLVVCMC